VLSSRVPPYGEMISQSGWDCLDLRLAAIRSFPAFESEPKKRALGAAAGARENWFAGEAF
jgi:hypothetical protein